MFLFCFIQSSILKNSKYVCYYGNKCRMTPRERKRCKLCRWKMCLEAGKYQNKTFKTTSVFYHDVD